MYGTQFHINYIKYKDNLKMEKNYNVFIVL